MSVDKSLLRSLDTAWKHAQGCYCNFQALSVNYDHKKPITLALAKKSLKKMISLFVR
jgi:hypothetical protein